MQELDTIIENSASLFLANDEALSLILLESMINNEENYHNYVMSKFLSSISQTLALHAIKCAGISSEDEYGLEYFCNDSHAYVYNDLHYSISSDNDYNTEFDRYSKSVHYENAATIITIWINSFYRIKLQVNIIRSNYEYFTDLNTRKSCYEIQDGDITTSVQGNTFMKQILLFLNYCYNGRH